MVKTVYKITYLGISKQIISSFRYVWYLKIISKCGQELANKWVFVLESIPCCRLNN